MKKLSTLFISLILVGVIACESGSTADNSKSESPKEEEKVDSLLNKARAYFKPQKESADNPDNPITAEKVALGKALYFDSRLSKDGNNSCNSCHNLNTYGVDNLATSPGDLGGNGERNSPTTLNAAFHMAQFWDGRAADVEEQAGGPILNPVEMNIPSKEYLEKRLSEIPEYQELFAQAFPEAENPIIYDHVQKSIAAFERTLITTNRFDDYLKGNTSSLNDQEQRGLKTFIETGCITCHMGAQMGGQIYQKFGLFGNYWELTGSENIDSGRVVVTGVSSDKFMFKVPSLRNVEKTAPYFHDGSISDLKKAVTIMATLQLNKQLSDQEADDLVAFLNSLTGDISDEQKMPPAFVNTVAEL